MSLLNVNICGVDFKNPVIAASGTYGFGKDYTDFFPLERLGGISCKGTTLLPRLGNPPPRVAETASGILNSVGLQNPGVRHFISEDLPWLLEQNTVVIANAAGSTVEDYSENVALLAQSGVHMIELNISCPNVKEGGVAFGTSCASVEKIVGAAKKVSGNKPLIVKLSPNVTSIAEIARAAESAGADALSLINTITGMKIDVDTRRPILRNNTGGLSGAALLPVAVRMVWEVRRAVALPIIGMGGVTKWQDAAELILAGADAIQIGTACFANPFAPPELIGGLEEWVQREGCANIAELSGRVRPW
ncbi:MAG: dihydroorotate dehydrogenase [Oscillospiraceae bacterium]|jgi:dihydroorotate dehydrogenase (NAD+) catalytic subunit|nr:dihydroorotate dehydrogenase [Oscillospiraceae bacterium]